MFFIESKAILAADLAIFVYGYESMKESLHLICLRTVPHNDRHSILRTFSLERGPMTFLQPAGNGREASRRRALLMPLGLVECVADIRPGRDIHIMSQPRCINSLQGIRSNPIKTSVALFIAEVLDATVREAQPDRNIWHFVENSVMMLDALPGNSVANFHICFLMRLGPLLGIEPDVSTYSPGRVFDMIDGVFRASPPLHRNYLDSKQAEAVAALSRINYLNMHLFKMSRDERAEMLDGILRYYSIHYAPLTGLKSLEVLRMLF